MFAAAEQAGLRLFRFTELERIEGFVHAFTSRRPDRSDVETGLQAAAALAIAPGRLLLLRQVHSSRTLLLSPDGKAPRRTVPGILGPADGVVCGPGIFPVVRTADCVPVVAVEPETRLVGTFHAGWRGACGRLVARGLAAMIVHHRLDPRRIVVMLGPSIRRCCYRVGEDVIGRFRSAGHDLARIVDGGRLDLVESVRMQAESVGVEQILDSGLCTCCRTDLFPSWRAERTRERLWTIAGFHESAVKQDREQAWTAPAPPPSRPAPARRRLGVRRPRRRFGRDS